MPSNICSGAVAFHRLPEEIIEQILLTTDPSGFASLVLLNSKWRVISQRSHIYAHHLAQCLSYAASHSDVPSANDEDLPLLRRLFAQQVKRNLFDAYLRPRQTLVKLISNSISSSSCPGGEGLQFGFSSTGQHILAYNSSRIYLIDVRNQPINVQREFKIQRRPVSVCITDDADTLAVLSTELQVDIYNLSCSPPERRQSLILDNSSQTIAISSCGTVLAAAYDGGIEVSSLGFSALPSEKRVVKCHAVDALAFSRDGAQILGCTVHSSPATTVVLTAPYHDPGIQRIEEKLSAMWTTSIIFPNTSRDWSHAIWLPASDQSEPEFTLTYDRSFETFRVVRLDHFRNGTTYFTGPVPNAAPQTKLLPCTLPATTSHGELVCAGFQGKEIWIYGVPEDLGSVPDLPLASCESSHNSSNFERYNSRRSTLSCDASGRGNDGGSNRLPQWQVLCDKLGNNSVAGVKVTDIDGVSGVGWVGRFGDSPCRERLVVTATGVTGSRLATDKEDMDFMDGGRVALLDFDYGLVNGETTEVTIEIGTDNAEPLTEERRDIETEVAIVRQRTVAQQRGTSARNVLLRTATRTATATATATAAATQYPSPLLPIDQDDDDPLVPRIIGRNPVNRCDILANVQAVDEEFASIEQQEAMDAPYAHSSPRSQTTLRRAATAAAVNRQMNPRTADGRLIEYRRADGRADHPHDSDADNWVPPPPPYQKEDPGDLPAFLRGPAVAPTMAANFSTTTPDGATSEAGNDSPTFRLAGSARSSSFGAYTRGPSTLSESTNESRLRGLDVPRPRSTPSVHSVQMDSELYTVSPQASPRMPLERLMDRSTSFSRATSPSSSQNHASADALATPTSPAAASTTCSLSPCGSSSWLRARPAAPSLEFQVPVSPSLGTLSASSNVEPAARRLPNAQTWPRQPQFVPLSDGTSGQQAGGHSYTTPPSNVNSNDLATAALPPAPSSNQIASLNKRISQGNPRRLSGNMLNPRLWIDNSQSTSAAGPTHQSPPVKDFASRQPSEAQLSESDRPLIISTPTALSGSNDTPPRTSITQTETPILAPVPRRPQADMSAQMGTAQQLENIYGNQPAPAPLPPHMRSNVNALPMWVRTPSNSSRLTPTGVNRRRSRAERSAAKNIKDARLKGWRAKKKMKNKQPTSDGSGWVDVPADSLPKTSKCIIM